jgi:SAM-dependent methyltransferase
VEARSIVHRADAGESEGGELDGEAYGQRSYELWQQMAARWERGREVLWETTRPVSEWLIERLSPQPGQTILELAAGAGETGFLAAGRLGDQGRLISSDFAPRMVETAKRVADELGITNAEFRVLDAERLELEDASVDALLAEAGFAYSQVETMEIGFRFGGGDSLWAYVSELQGPIALAITKLDEEERHVVRAAIEDGYTTFRKNGAYELPGLVLNVHAG